MHIPENSTLKNESINKLEISLSYLLLLLLFLLVKRQFGVSQNFRHFAKTFF
jgi:hypothetical protein